MTESSRGAYRCIARRFPGQIGRAALLRMAPRIATVAAALLLDRVIPSIPSLHLRGEMNPAIWQMQLAAVLKLLPPPEMSRGIPHTAARKVQGWLLVGLGQCDDRVLVSSPAGVHTAPGDSNRAQHTRFFFPRCHFFFAVRDGLRGA